MSATRLPAHIIPARSKSQARVTVSMKLTQRVVLYCKDRINVTQSTEAALREGLAAMGVDLAVPHDAEPYGDWDGKPITFAEAKKLGLVDVKGRPMPGLGEDQAEPGAVL